MRSRATGNATIRARVYDRIRSLSDLLQCKIPAQNPSYRKAVKGCSVVTVVYSSSTCNSSLRLLLLKTGTEPQVRHRRQSLFSAGQRACCCIAWFVQPSTLRGRGGLYLKTTSLGITIVNRRVPIIDAAGPKVSLERFRPERGCAKAL